MTWGELCPTCSEPYSKRPTPRASICSNGFHCCRDCTRIDGRVTEECVDHRTTRPPGRVPVKIKYLATWADRELDDVLTGVDALRSFDDTRGVLAVMVGLYRALRDHHVEETTELWARIEELKGQLEGCAHVSELTADGLGAYCRLCGETLG